MNNTTQYNDSTTGNFTGTRRPSSDFYRSSRFIFAVFEGTFIPVIVTVNLVVIVAILSNSRLRQNFRHLVIFSIALCDIIIGLVTCPVRVAFIARRNVYYGCSTYIFISVFELFVQMFVGTWGIVSLNMDYLLTLFQVKFPQLSPLIRKLVMVFLVTLPWLIMSLIIFPIAFTHAGRVYISKKYCNISVNKSVRDVIIFLSFMAPAAIAIIQVIVMTTVYLGKRRARNATPSLMTSELSPPWMLLCASLITVLLVLGEQTVYVLNRRVFAKLGMKAIVNIYYTFVSLSDGKSAILPFVWFMCPKIRTSCMDLYNKLPWRRTVDVYRSDLTVDYKTLEEEGNS